MEGRTYLLVSDARGYPPSVALLLVVLFGMAAGNLGRGVHASLGAEGGYVCALPSAPRGTTLFSFCVRELCLPAERARRVCVSEATV